MNGLCFYIEVPKTIPYTIRKMSYKIQTYGRTHSGRHYVELAPGWQYRGNHSLTTLRLATMYSILKLDTRACFCDACKADIENLAR